MSIEAVSWALKQNIPPAEKLVLVSLADHHNRATGLCIPGQVSVSEQTCMSVRTVQRHLKSLEGRGLIVRNARFRPDGRGRTSDSYLLQGDNLTHGTDTKGDKSGRTKATNQDDQGDNGVRAITGREPEENRKTITACETRSRKTAVPESWRPPSNIIEDLQAKFPRLNVAEQVDTFLDYHRSKGSKFADWDAAFRNWIRNAEKYRQQNSGEKAGGWR